MMEMRHGFDDFLGLRAMDFSTARLVAFAGVSGSGKSSCMDFLTRIHADYAGADVFHINPGRAGGMQLPGPHRLLCADDVLTMAEFAAVLGFLRRGGRAVITTHLPRSVLQAARLFGPAHILRTDRDTAKLSRWLDARGIGHTRAVLADYAARYRASYTDMKLILEHTGETADFDRAYRGFHKFCRIDPCPERG